MKELPHIDEHSTQIPAATDRVWAALTESTRRLAAGPGFSIAEVRAGERIALRGRHPFSRYELVFELEELGPERSRLRAVTNAAFPGPHGCAYRALVIGSGGHRVVVRRMLRAIGRRA
jgi:hypothetical protein